MTDLDQSELVTAGGSAAATGQHVAIITGLSGAGKTAASKLFEDLGYTVVDNVPSELLRDLAELVANDPERYRRVALVLDVRSGQRAARARRRAGGAPRPRHRAPDLLPRGDRRGAHPALRETRHRHPLDTENDGVGSAIARERAACSTRSARMAQTIIDTSDLSSASCGSASSPRSTSQPGPDQLALQVISFGFKYGVPLEADLVFDVRFMENPFYRTGAAAAFGPRRSRSASSCWASRSPQRFLDVPARVPRVRRSRPTTPRARRA